MPAPKQSKFRLRDKRRRIVWVKVAAGSAVVLVSLVLVWFGARVPQLTITEVTVSGAGYADEKHVGELASSSLQGSFLLLFPRANTLFASLGTVQKVVADAFPQVAAVGVSRDGLTGIHVSLTERVPDALWCRDANCYVMDASGYIFERGQPSDTYVEYRGDVESEPIGQTFLGGGFEALSGTVHAVASASGRSISVVDVDGYGDVKVMFREGGVLYFTLNSDAGVLSDDIASVFSTPDARARVLEYADFRFGNKVYVKYREQN